MTQPRQKAITWWVLIGALGLLGSGMLIAYSTSTKLETALGELQTAYAAEQAKTQKLTQEAEALVKAMEQTQARVKAVEESHRASEQAKGRLEARGTKLETALGELQTAYATEQAKTKKLTQKAEALVKAMEQAQARVKAVEGSHRAAEQARGKLEAKGTKLETALRELQTAYATEQAKTKKLTQKAEALVKAMEQTQARVKAVGESRRAAGQAKGKLEAKGTKLETALQELQTPYATEQAKTQKPTKEMAKTLELITRLRVDMVALHHAIGVRYNMMAMNEEALKAFQMAVELDPNHAESHFDLARVYIEYLDDSESAVPHFRRYVQLRPEAKDVEQIKGWLMKVEKELEIKKERRGWGKGLSQGLYKIFY
jgi:chromosome segregation ATPase